MSYQKCPVCNGTGEVINPNPLNFGTIQCPTCNGQRIISELTGRPPSPDIDKNAGHIAYEVKGKHLKKEVDELDDNTTYRLIHQVSNCPNGPGQCFCTGACEKQVRSLRDNNDINKDNKLI